MISRRYLMALGAVGWIVWGTAAGLIWYVLKSPTPGVNFPEPPSARRANATPSHALSTILASSSPTPTAFVSRGPHAGLPGDVRSSVTSSEGTSAERQSDAQGSGSRSEAVFPGVRLMEGEPVMPDEVVAFTRFVLVEEGPAVKEMSQWRVNINSVRYDVNSYRIGYSLAVMKEGGAFAFTGPIHAWRATATGEVSVWPPFIYPATRNETMRRAGSLEPARLVERCPGMEQLRIYYQQILTGYEHGNYCSEPTVLAFLIDPDTGRRMSAVASRRGFYQSIDAPFRATCQLYVQEVASYSAGPFGLGRARVPSVFYARGVGFEAEPVAADSGLYRAMNRVLAAHGAGPIDGADFGNLFDQMRRFTSQPLTPSSTAQASTL